MNAIQQLLTDHIDIWTAADTEKKSGRGRSSGNASNVYGIKKLRELILELAVRGKLVQQDPNDEPASELLKRIQAEKAKLIAEGKIKKGKPLTEITEEEKPFELPQKWEWTRLGEITNFGATEKLNLISHETWVLDLEDIEKDTSKLLQKCRFSERRSLSDKNSFQAGDVLYGKLRPYLNKVIVADEAGVCTTEILPVRCYGPFSSNYFKFALKSPYFINYVNARSYGMKMPRLGTEDGRKAYFPLPPLAEQHRIVAKVDELMALCDQLETQHSNVTEAHEKLVSHLLGALTQSQNAEDFSGNWQRIAAHFDTLFTTEASIDALKKTLLQLAVMGKLVPQDPNDEPANELARKINLELCNIIDAPCLPKLYRDKSTFDPIDFHFQIPRTWVWCELQDIAIFENGKAHEQLVTENKSFVLVNSSFISNNGDKVKYVTDRLAPLSKGDIAIVMSDVPSGRALVRCFLVTDNDKFTLNQRIGALRTGSRISKRYLLKVLERNKYYLQHDDGKKQTNLKKIQIMSCPIPLPPLAEQHRIVAKVDELMALCEALKTRINEAQRIQIHLADTIVNQALA